MAPSDAALRCVIQALHDRTPGLYIHESTIVGLPGTPSTADAVYLIKTDGSVEMTTNTYDPELCTLQAPSAYDACLASVASDSTATAECRNVTWVSGCTPGTLTCE